MPGVAAYNASKAAGWSLTQSFRADLAKRGIRVHGVFPGAVDTEMARSFEIPKTPAIDVAHATLAGIDANEEDIYPDPMAQQVYAAWREDHKAAERQFAACERAREVGIQRLIWQQTCSPRSVLGGLELPNRIVMAPLTRNRAGQPGNVPQPINATYYAQRASAGLSSPRAHRFRTWRTVTPAPPVFTALAQVAGWKQVTDTVHARGGRIFLQLWHVGRISHPSLLPTMRCQLHPPPSNRRARHSPVMGMTDFVTPRALETSEIPALIENFRNAAHNAKTAGFDGVEVHGANGYLLDQFLRDGSNQRTDQYGGSIANRTRLLQEVVAAVCEVWGADRVGVRISPLNQYNDMRDSNPQALFNHVADRFVHSLWPICT